MWARAKKAPIKEVHRAKNPTKALCVRVNPWAFIFNRKNILFFKIDPEKHDDLNRSDDLDGPYEMDVPDDPDRTDDLNGRDDPNGPIDQNGPDDTRLTTLTDPMIRTSPTT